MGSDGLEAREREVMGDPVHHLIIDALTDAAEPMTRKDIATVVPRARTGLSWRLEQLASVGRIYSSGDDLWTAERRILDVADEPEPSVVEDAMVQRRVDRILSWRDLRHSPDWANWHQAAISADMTLPPLTPAETDELWRDIYGVVTRWREATQDREVPEGGEAIFLTVSGTPLRADADLHSPGG